jgi:hypothetical protein
MHFGIDKMGINVVLMLGNCDRGIICKLTLLLDDGVEVLLPSRLHRWITNPSGLRYS